MLYLKNKIKQLIFTTIQQKCFFLQLMINQLETKLNYMKKIKKLKITKFSAFKFYNKVYVILLLLLNERLDYILSYLYNSKKKRKAYKKYWDIK